MSPRAPALPPTERRVSIVRSALALIRERGTLPTTREIAEAAGVAEGTVFRAFDTKERLVEAVVEEAFCPAPVALRLAAIDEGLPLRERLVALVTVLQDRFSEIFGVMGALGLTAPPAHVEEHRGCRPETGHVPLDEQELSDDNDCGPPGARMQAFVEPFADQLTCSPADLVRYLRLLTFSASHPEISAGPILRPRAIVDLLLDGTLTPAARGLCCHEHPAPRIPDATEAAAAPPEDH